MPTSSFLDEYVNNFKIEYGADMIQDCEDQQLEKDFVFGDSELEEMASFSSNMLDRKPQTITQNLLQGSGNNEGWTGISDSEEPEVLALLKVCRMFCKGIPHLVCISNLNSVSRDYDVG
ncbi:hypothetical protein FRX31_008288 [Thalictrum thalictroides]|uniref:Uncharacterized protein n=1 Tax=Thalictrum thalictroides TaxID=46969 RepID=A0A7J6WZW7_THATH|nr:hypothetical protein FRX31_008288 [Thalictrum thalictroides]